MYDLKKVIEANTVDGVINYDGVMGTIDNDYVNPIVAKKTDKTKLIPEVVADVVKELGIDGTSIDDLKLYVKKMGGSTDEIKEANIKLENELKELKGLYDVEVETRTKIENETRLNKEIAAIKGLGIEDKDAIDFYHYKFNKAVTEEKTFEQVVEEYAKENDVKTTTRFVKDDFGSGGSSKDLDIGAAWKEKRSHTRK